MLKALPRIIDKQTFNFLLYNFLTYYMHSKQSHTLVWTYVDPGFCSMHSHSMVKLLFYLLVKNMIFRKDFESPLIFVLFLMGKQNKKENSKYDSLFGKTGM